MSKQLHLAVYFAGCGVARQEAGLYLGQRELPQRVPWTRSGGGRRGGYGHLRLERPLGGAAGDTQL